MTVFQVAPLDSQSSQYLQRIASHSAAAQKATTHAVSGTDKVQDITKKPGIINRIGRIFSSACAVLRAKFSLSKPATSPTPNTAPRYTPSKILLETQSACPPDIDPMQSADVHIADMGPVSAGRIERPDITPMQTAPMMPTATPSLTEPPVTSPISTGSKPIRPMQRLGKATSTGKLKALADALSAAINFKAQYVKTKEFTEKIESAASGLEPHIDTLSAKYPEITITYKGTALTFGQALKTIIAAQTSESTRNELMALLQNSGVSEESRSQIRELGQIEQKIESLKHAKKIHVGTSVLEDAQTASQVSQGGLSTAHAASANLAVGVASAVTGIVIGTGAAIAETYGLERAVKSFSRSGRTNPNLTQLTSSGSLSESQKIELETIRTNVKRLGQKKVIKKSFNLFSAGCAIASGVLAIAAATPVGWVIGGIGLAIGLGTTIYRYFQGKRHENKIQNARMKINHAQYQTQIGIAALKQRIETKPAAEAQKMLQSYGITDMAHLDRLQARAQSPDLILDMRHEPAQIEDFKTMHHLQRLAQKEIHDQIDKAQTSDELREITGNPNSGTEITGYQFEMEERINALRESYRINPKKTIKKMGLRGVKTLDPAIREKEFYRYAKKEIFEMLSANSPRTNTEFHSYGMDLKSRDESIVDRMGQRLYRSLPQQTDRSLLIKWYTDISVSRGHEAENETLLASSDIETNAVSRFSIYAK